MLSRKTLILGLIAGALSSVWALFLPFLGTDFEGISGMIFGYTAMLAGFSMIFVSIKNYRDNLNGGYISFGQGFGIGLLITLIASTVYVITWMLVNKYMIPDFAEKYASTALEHFKATNPIPEALEKYRNEMAGFVESYKNPLYRVGMTYMEILPVGLLVSVIASLILKRKNRELAEA